MKRARNLALSAGLLLSACAHAPARPMIDLEPALRQQITAIDSGTVAVSFIDLESGQEVHINGDVVMHAASTMKVPVLFELYRQAETGKLSLDQTIEVRNRFQSIADTSHYSLDAGDDSDSAVYKLIGQQVRIRELARHMITRSSNLATNLLIDLVGPANVRQTVTRIGADGMNVQRGVEDIPAFRRGMNNTTTSKGLAHALTAIVECKVVSKKSCQEMIEILSAQEFNEMIPAGLPAGTKVAHKTGSITGINHDGGIVYRQHGRPYVLVILTRNVKDAHAVGAQISRIVWEHAAN